MSVQRQHPLLLPLSAGVPRAAAGVGTVSDKRTELLSTAAVCWHQFMAVSPPLATHRTSYLGWARFTLETYGDDQEQRERCSNILCELSVDASGMSALTDRMAFFQLSRPFLTATLREMPGERGGLRLSTWLVCLQHPMTDSTPLYRLKRRLTKLETLLPTQHGGDERHQQRAADVAAIKCDEDRQLLHAVLLTLRESTDVMSSHTPSATCRFISQSDTKLVQRWPSVQLNVGAAFCCYRCYCWCTAQCALHILNLTDRQDGCLRNHWPHNRTILCNSLHVSICMSHYDRCYTTKVKLRKRLCSKHAACN